MKGKGEFWVLVFLLSNGTPTTNLHLSSTWFFGKTFPNLEEFDASGCGSTRNETEMECSMRLMLLGEINPDPHARVVGFRATWHNAGVWKAGFNVNLY